MGVHVVHGRRAAVEWWAAFLESDKEMTLTGCLLLRFTTNRECCDLREYWNTEPQRVMPFDDWGT
jgi:hypothetical protein